MAASTVIIQLDDVGQMLAGPTAKRFAAFATAIDRVGETNLQDSFLRLLRSFLYAQGERMEVQDRISFVHQSAGRNVSVAKDHMTAGVLRRVIANEADKTEPVGVAMIVAIHDFDLAKMNPFAANIDIGRCLVI